MKENDSSIENHAVVSHEEWLAARRALLAKEKEFTRLRDELTEQRRALPWEAVTKEYDVFITIGSSGAVYPAAGFVAAARGRAHTVYVGPERPDNASAFDELRLGKAGDVVPSLFDAE